VVNGGAVGRGLFGGEGAGRREDASVDAAPVVQEVATATCNSLTWAGEAGGEMSGPVGDWGARDL
jgi:hypothetical protein